MQGNRLHFEALTGLPMVRAGDDLAALICTAAERADTRFVDGDILVVAQKIVSKAEGRIVKLADVIPSPAAVDLARETEKDPRLVELVLRESTDVLRKKPGVIIVRHRLGIVGAQAGIDQSNVEHDEGEAALLLPLDPDASAARLRATLSKLTGKKLGIIISDSMNRPWRLGTIGGAIGCAGIGVLDDRRGQHDIYGRELKVTMINRADSIAAAAVLVMGETTERTPVALVRGFPPEESAQSARDTIRPLAEDLFR
jgi:coenzyme F420-0:L-glutamate ligase / coenzyme F420-1:gamma-L-glutamate ligase